MNRELQMNCMTVIVGKKVSKTGRVLLAHNEDDSGHVVVRHAYVPPMLHDEGEYLPAEYGLASVPQAAKTIGFYWMEYVSENGGLTSADSFLNDCGVAIVSNSMGWSREDSDDPSVVKDGGIGYVLRRILAERAHTAREGASILQKLIEKWGYAPSGRAYTIADSKEAFMFQLVRGHHYIGARVPDNAVAVMPNHYNFHTLHDCPEMFYPDDIVNYAIQKGWYIPKDSSFEDFDFADAYQSEKSRNIWGNLLRQKHGSRIVMGRDWDLDTDGIPFCIYPESQVDLQTLRSVMSSHYDNTEDDFDRFGPGRSPHYSTEKRRICTGTTLECTLWNFEEEPKNICIFTSLGRPCQVPVIPLHPLRFLPETLKSGEESAQMLKTHLLPHPQVSCASGSVYDRYRRLCGLQEMLSGKDLPGISDQLDKLFQLALEENDKVQKCPSQAAELDEDFLNNALLSVESMIPRLTRVKIISVSPIMAASCDYIISMILESYVEPKEETLLFGLEYTSLKNNFSPAVSGSLKEIDDNKYQVQFSAEPFGMLLPYPGKHTFWLGGQDMQGKTFVAMIVCEVCDNSAKKQQSTQ